MDTTGAGKWSARAPPIPYDGAMTRTPPPGSAADVVRTWDARADRYLALFRHEWAGKPYDRAVLDEFAARVTPAGGSSTRAAGPAAT
jgi:hypothetical protein